MTVNLTSDEKDEILYLTRVNERVELETYLLNLSRTHQCDLASIIAAAVEDESRNTALHYAAANGHIDLLTYILSLYRNDNLPPVKSKQQTDGDTNISNSLVLQLLSSRNRAGNTPLHWASMNGHMEAVKMLHTAGADVSVLNGAGRDPLQEAVGAERIEVTEWLMRVKGDGGRVGSEDLEGDEGRERDGNREMDSSED